MNLPTISGMRLSHYRGHRPATACCSTHQYTHTHTNCGPVADPGTTMPHRSFSFNPGVRRQAILCPWTAVARWPHRVGASWCSVLVLSRLGRLFQAEELWFWSRAVLQLVFDSRAEHAERCWPKLKKKVFRVRFFQGLIVWLPKIIQRAMLQEFRLRIFDQSCLKSSPEPYFRKFRFRGIFKNPSLRPSLEPLRQFRLQRIFRNPPRKFSAEPCFRNFCFKQSSTQHPLNGTVLAGEFSKNLGKMSNTAGRLGEDFSSMSSGNVSSFFGR